MPRNILFIEASPGFGGSLTSLAGLIEHLDPSRYRAYAVVSHEIHAEYLRSHTPVESVVVDHPRLFKKPGRWGYNMASVLGPLRRSGQIATSASLAGLNLLGPVRQFARRIERTFSDVTFDGVWINNGIGNSHGGGALLARRWGVPLLCKVQGFGSVSRTDRAFARPIDLFLVDSVAVSEPLVQMGVPNEKIAPTYCPVDVARFDPSRVVVTHEFCRSGTTPTFGIVGLLLKWKGQEVFLEAAKRVFAAQPDSVAVIVGDDPLSSGERMRILQDRARQLGIAEKVVFTGHRADVPQVMANLDVVVHASISPEPFGTVIAEAMAMEKPVVAAGAGGPTEYVCDGDNGFLANPGDADQMAAAILKLLGDRDLRHRMGKNGRRMVCERFSTEVYARKTQDLLDATIESKKNSSD